ncbi:MAG: single-stranded-DNA-specific exonuclease RecJ [Holophagaceae bacterium]|nr:single-stranded-DNA-specific exonuclease RecJ [Holophagaceae bacterium]
MRPQPWRLRREIVGAENPWKQIQDAWNLEDGIARLAWMRGVDDPSELAWRLEPKWELTHEPYFLDNMGKAVSRINTAISKREKITIYGDYDVDGVTATALLFRVLERMGADVSFFIPNRFNDGYGIHLECIRELAHTHSPTLLISVDCGIQSIEEVKASYELGMEWIITDHHSISPKLPDAVAVIHPHLGTQANKHLAGVGVAFKLAQALMDAIPIPRGNDANFLDGLLKLVAIGTIADMVPLVQENALLVKRGLIALCGTNSPGLSLLLKASGSENSISATAIAFGIAPRINAVGRMGGAEDAVRLLLTRDFQEAQQLVERVEQLNQERRHCQRELTKILPPLASADEAFDLIVEPTAHKGVIGIVAGQRMRDLGQPAGVCSVIDGVAHCSLRAPEPFDLTELLCLARPFLKSGGGHKAAAGITFDMANLAFIREIFTKATKTQALEGVSPAINIDGSDYHWVPNRQALEQLEPFGQAWPEPSVVAHGQLERAPDLFGAGHWSLKLKELPFQLKWFFAEEKYPFGIPKDGQVLDLAISPQDSINWGRTWRVDALLDGSKAL